MPAPPPTDHIHPEIALFADDVDHVDHEESPAPRRRPLHPGIIASAALLATALASSVGAFAFNDSDRPAAAAATAPATGARQVVAVPPTADPVNDPGANASIGTAPNTAPAPEQSAAKPPPADPPAPPKSTAKPPPKPPAGDNASALQAVLDLVNQERAKAGCRPLGSDDRLAKAARLHSEDMAARGYFAHDTPEGVGMDKRITNAGYRWSSAGENIAKGQRDAASVMQSWMNSPGHRANILNCGFKHIGIGIGFQGRSPIWTQDFASPL